MRPAMTRMQPEDERTDGKEPAQVVIAGAGIVGLVLALALHKHVGVKAELYEQASGFQDGVGAGMGMYPNGLRVIRDISPLLLHQIQEQGYPYLFRRWERHDGAEVVYAEESMLGEDDLQPMGIRRWKLQKVLLEAVKAIGIIVVFRKKVREVQPLPSGLVELKFYDGTSRRTKLLLAADGAKSSIRTAVAGHLTKLRYTGITCLYGTASVPRETRGICLPSSGTTKCHACFYPTGPTEQCFQFHIPTSPNSKTEGGWATMLKRVGQEECRQLAKELQNDGWDQKYLKPLYHAEQAMKVPFALLRPPLKSFVYNRIVLIGDAAHPTVPYLGQGAQQGLEDSGTLALILQNLCLDSQGIFLLDRIDTALEIYNQMRVPRTAEILENAKRMGQMQQKRADNKRGYNQAKEELIRRDVFFHETMPVILPGATYNYREQVGKVLQHTPRVAVNEEEMS